MPWGVFERAPSSITEAARAALAAHRWPGNIRELRNVMERAVLVCEGNVIDAEHISFVQPDEPRTEPAPIRPHAGLRAEVDALERARIIAVLDECGGNRSEAARRLGISRGALLARLRAWGDLAKPRR